MARIHKLTKNGQAICPATRMDAVVHPELKVTASELIGEVNVSKIYPTGGTDGTDKYTLEAAVPLADIHLQPETLGAAAGDVGFVRSDDTATGITLREYWSNKDTALLSDLPHEASLAPNLWGLFRYEPAPEAAPEATPSP